MQKTHIGIMIDLLDPENHNEVYKAIETVLGQFTQELEKQLGTSKDFVKAVRMVSLGTIKPRKSSAMYDFRARGRKK